MTRVTVPREVAEALMDGSLRLLMVEGEIEFEPWRHCTTDCEATGRCPVCERSYPPAGRSVAPEAHGSYCEPECDGWDDDRRRSKHLWPGELARLDRQVPAAIVRAIEAGERIGIEVECGTCEGKQALGAHFYDPNEYDGPCPHCTDGRVLVGSVRPTEVLPVVICQDPRDDDLVSVGFDPSNAGAIWRDNVVDGVVDLSVYGPAESLVGKFAVEVTDARREP